MANILDIFRTHVGNELVEKTFEETRLNPKEIHRAYIFTLPFVLSVHRSKCDQGTNHSKEFASELEKIQLTNLPKLKETGEKIFANMFSSARQEKIIALSRDLGISEKSLEKILKISCGLIFAILSQISSRKNLKREDHCKLLDSLSGVNAVYEQDVAKLFTQHDDSGNLIHTEEEIALGSDENEDDESILGGYAGGR